MTLYLGTNRVCTTILRDKFGIPLEVSSQGELQKPTTSFTWSLPSSVTALSERALAFAFYNCKGITSVDLSSLITIENGYALYNAFGFCTNLTSVDLSGLTTLSSDQIMAYAFTGCTNLTSIDLSSLTTLSGSSAMTYAFRNCTKLTTLSFPALTSTSFGSNTSQFTRMLEGVTGCTVHFPSNLQSVIGNWTSVTNGFNGTNTTILFDLPATT